MSGESVNNSAELTLGINTKPAETAIGELQTKLNGLVKNLDNLNKAAGVQHVVSPEAAKEVTQLANKIRELEGEIEGLKLLMKNGGTQVGNAFQSGLQSGVGNFKLSRMVLPEDQQRTIAEKFGKVGVEGAAALVNGFTNANFSKQNQALQYLEQNTEKSLKKIQGMMKAAQDVASTFGSDTARAKFGDLFFDPSFKAKIDQQLSLVRHLQDEAAKAAQAQAKARSEAEIGQKRDLELWRKQNEALREQATIRERLSQRSISMNQRNAQWDRLNETVYYYGGTKEQIAALERQLKLVTEIQDKLKAGQSLRTVTQQYGTAAISDYTRGAGYSPSELKSFIEHIRKVEADRIQAKKDADKVLEQADRAYLAEAKARLKQHYAEVKADSARSAAERQMHLDQLAKSQARQQRVEVNSIKNANWGYDYGGDLKKQLQNQLKIAQEVEKAIQAQLSSRSIVEKFGSSAFTSVNSGATSVAAFRTQLDALNQTNTRTTGTTRSLTQANQAARDAAREHREQQAMLHSTLRGVAGGLDNLWLTYGRFIPQMVSAYAAVSAFRKAATEGIRFDYQTQFISALGGDRALSAQNIQDQLLSIQGSPANVNELATSLRVLQQTGIDAAEGMGLLKTVISASTLGETSLKVAAEDIVGVLEVFNLHSEDPLQLASNFRKAGDVLAYVAQETKANLHDVAAGMQAATGISSQYNISLEKVAATAAVLGKQGIVGSKSGTFIRNFVEELYQPRSDKSRKALAELGVNAYDDKGQAKEYVSLIKELIDKLKEYKSVARDAFVADIFGERGKKPFRGIMQDFDGFLEKIREAEAANGLLEKQTSKLAETTQYQLQQLKADYDNLFIKTWSDDSLAAPIQALRDAIGSADLQQLFRSIVQAVVELGTALANNIDSVVMFGKGLATWLAFQTLHGSVAMLARGIGLLGPAIGAVVTAIGGGSLAVQSFSAVAAGAASSLAGKTGIVGALGTVSPILGAVASALGGVTIALGVAGVAWYLFRDRTAEALEDSTLRLRSYGREVAQILSGIEQLPAAAARTAAERAAGGLDSKHSELREEQARIAKRYGLNKNDLVGDFNTYELANKATSSYNIYEVLGTLKAKNKEYATTRDQVLAGLRTASAKEFDVLKVDRNRVNQEIADGTYGNAITGSKDRAPKPTKGGRSSNAAANEAYRTQITKYEGELRSIVESEREQLNDLETQRNLELVSFGEFYDRKLAIMDKATQDRIEFVTKERDAAEKSGNLPAVKQYQAELDVLAAKLLKGNDSAVAKLKTDEIQRATIAWKKLNTEMSLDVKKVGDESRYDLAMRTASAEERVTLEINKQVTAYKDSKIAAMGNFDKKDTEEYKAQLALVTQGVEEYRQALIAAAEANRVYSSNWVNGATEAWNAWKDSANNAAKITKESFTRVFQKVDEVFLDFIRTGKLNFKSLGQTIKDEVIKLLYELTVKKFVIGITGDFSNLALALGGTALKSILGVSGGGGSTSGSGTNYTGLASNASTAYSVYGGAKAAYAAYQGTAAGLSASETGAATWAYLQSGDFGTALGVALKGALGTEASTATTAASLEAYYAAQGLEASTMGVATEAGLGGAAGLSWASALFAIPFIAKFFNDRSRPLPLEFTGLGVDGQYDGKNFDGTLATNYMRGGSYWDQRMQLTNDAAIVAQNYQNLKPPVIEIANPDYTTWQNAYQEAGFQNQIGDNAYRNGDETFYAPSKISGYDEGYTPAPYSTDPTVLGNIDAAIEAAFNAPKSAMKKVAELFGDAELATQIDAFTAKISVSGRNIGEILGKIGAQVTTDLGQAFLPSIEAARVQGAALRTGLETAIANATTAGDTEAVNTLKAQMEAIGIAASETWSQTFERVLKETDAVSKAMDLLGVSLKDIGDANKVLTLSDNLVTLFGGIDAMNSSVNAYYGNFYTEAEKQERVWKNMGETFKSLNLAMPTTREGFRDLVEAQDLTTTAGQQTFVALMNVQGAFADLTPAMNAAATAAEALAVTAEQLGSAKSALMGYFTTAQRRSVLTGNIYDTALENGVDLGGESLTNLSNASRQDFAAYVQSVANEGTEASRRMLVALAAIAPVFEDLVALAEAAAAADLQAAIDKTQSAIDALTGQYGDVATAMLEINPPAKTLVESWRDNKTALEALQGTFDQFFGVTIPDAAATIQSLLTQLSAFEGGAETARSNADNARLQGMTPTERAAFWRNQEATLWQGLGNSTDKAGTISKIMDAYANTRAAELDALTGEQTKLNDAQKTGIQDQIDAWKTTLSVIEQSKRLVEDIDKTLAGLAYSDLSNLGYTDQLGAASSSYSNTLSKAAAGDTNAMGNLTSIARDYLTEAQTYFGGATLDYSNVYDQVTGELKALGLGLNTDGAGAQSEIDRLTASLSRIPGDLKAAFDTQTAEGYERIATALDAGTQYSTARLDEQKAQLQTQIDQQKVVIANQEAQIRQQADNHAALMERLAEQNARLAALESNSNLTVAA